MMMKRFLLLTSLAVIGSCLSQKTFPQPQTLKVFENTSVNFAKEGRVEKASRLQDGRLIIKKVNAPVFAYGTDVKIKVTVKSNGDRWDKSGSIFVIPDMENINLLAVAEGNAKFPANSMVEETFGGVKTTPDYQPAVELLRFMTPFGVGHYSDEVKFPSIKYSRPVYVPKWENEVHWTQDISQLSSLVQGDFYIGVWIDTWTSEGYLVDVDLIYSGRPRPTPKVLPLQNTVYYANGQRIPDFFSRTSLAGDFNLTKTAKNVTLHYITTGHGGHAGGDEFIKINNTMEIDGQKAIDFIPWRDDCSSFRRFNPSSGVWVKKDTASYYNDDYQRVKGEVTERLASSDLSRSNWCPGSSVEPLRVNLGSLEAGRHNYEVIIPATANQGDENNHWLVSSYLTFE